MSNDFNKRRIEDFLNQNKRDIDNDGVFIVEEPIDDLNDNINVNSSTSNDAIFSDAEKALDRSMSELSSSSKDYSKFSDGPVDSIGAKGYGDNSGVNNTPPSTGMVPYNNSNNAGNSSSPRSSGLGERPDSGLDKKETAPDIGKDYGDSNPATPEPAGNGYGALKDNPVTRGDQAGEPGDDLNNQNNINNTGAANNPNENGDSLDKKNGLEDPNKQTGDQNGEQSKKKTDDESLNRNQESNKSSNTGGGDTGNGYGALRRGADGKLAANNNQAATPGTKVSNMPSVRVRRPTGSAGGLGGIGNPFSRMGSGLKNAFGGIFGNKTGGKLAGKGAAAIGGAIKGFILRHPFVMILIGLLILFLLMIIASLDTNFKNRGKRSCTYNLTGISATGPVELTDLKVEVINCDGNKNGYTVLETVDFEKYVLGVALAEAGPSSPDEALKAQMIAVRNFSLTRHRGMCPSNPDNCFHGYNASTGIIRMRACTNDQVYWDYTKDCPAQDRDGQPTLYCVGVESPTKTWKKALSEQRQKEVEALAEQVMGEVLLDENGDILKLGYKAPQTEQFIEMANNGSDYKEILSVVYGSDSYSSATCTYSGSFDYGDYELTSEGTDILHEPLDGFLQKNGTSLEEFNELIADNVDDAGWGTRQGVVAAAVTLIAELGNNYGVKVPYYWGGGHYDGVVDGALGYWGSTKCHTTANGQSYDYCGFDCSGFVPWAIKNGGFKKGVDLASNFQNMPDANRVTLRNELLLQPGDLLESEGHIVLIVGIDEEKKQYICAEAMGNAYGVLFTRRAYNESGYWGVDLEDYYNNPSHIREPIR